MAFGISGDSNNPVTIAGGSTENDILIELRVISNLLQSPQLGTNQAMDSLPSLRADQALDLSIPNPPAPGS